MSVQERIRIGRIIEKIEKNGVICAAVRSKEPVITDSQSAIDLLMTAKYETGTKDVWTIGPAKWNVDDVQNYLTEHHPGCMIELYKTDYNVDGNEDGTVTKTPLNYYHVISSEELSYRQEIELGGELYEQFGMRPRGGFMESNNLNATGHNALEQPGDTNLDCEVDILDVIAANKHILGIGTLDKTGLKNADMDGNGTADTADSLAILKKALE